MPPGSRGRSVLANAPGFAHSPDLTHLAVRARALPGDPLALKAGRRWALLGIQTHTRRRNRMNGLVESIDGDGFTVAVQQSFGNCPKYITPREAVFTPSAAGTPRIVRSHGLDDRARDPRRGRHPVHRDGPPRRGPRPHARGRRGRLAPRRPAGLPRRDDEDVLRLPDYPGNFFFNTFGNLGLNPRGRAAGAGPRAGRRAVPRGARHRSVGTRAPRALRGGRDGAHRGHAATRVAVNPQ